MRSLIEERYPAIARRLNAATIGGEQPVIPMDGAAFERRLASTPQGAGSIGGESYIIPMSTQSVRKSPRQVPVTEEPEWLRSTDKSIAADLSKTRYDDPTKAKDGEEIFLTKEYKATSGTGYGGSKSVTVPPGNYTVDIRDEGIGEGSDLNTITEERRIRTYLIDPKGNEYLIKQENTRASDNWSLWDNPFFIPSWFY